MYATWCCVTLASQTRLVLKPERLYTAHDYTICPAQDNQ